MTTLTKGDLAQFTGTTQWFQHPLCRNVHYTEGVQYVAEHGGAYWLIDKIATLQLDPKIRAQEFQVWTLANLQAGTLPPGKQPGWWLVATDGDDTTLHTERLDFSDFPLDEISFWVEGDVILLPSEH